MTGWVVLGVALLAAWVALEFRTGRPDGDLLRTHPIRRLMFYIMPTRTESVVYFDSAVDATALQAYLDAAHAKFGAHVTHALVGAVAVGLAENPAMNKFVAGKRLYQRRGRWITFSMKRKKLDRAAKLGVVKLAMIDGETFEQLCKRIDTHVAEERSGRPTSADREYDLFTLLPRPLLHQAQKLLRAVDHFGLLPGWFIDGDGMYASVFLANLGSLDMAPGYHHLFEWGNCPLFVMVGAIEQRAVVVDGQVVARPILPIRYTYDERIDDGLNARFGIEAVKRVLEDPFHELGCLADDRSDAMPLGGKAEALPGSAPPA